jgi:signal transduction histidine kinase
LIVSVAGLVVAYVDPTEPLISRWIAMRVSAFDVDPRALAILIAHMLYSVSVILILRRPQMPRLLEPVTTWLDVAFGVAISAFTEGINTPMYAFFVFAVTASGLTAGLRRALVVTTVSVILYLSLILVSDPGITEFYIMRPVYLAVIGYLVGYLGQARLKLEAGVRELAAASERRQIARDLHDGRAQALSGINLSLETCRELLRRGAPDKALAELSSLQSSINREYDDLRIYMRSLVGLEATPNPEGSASDTRFVVRIDIDGGAQLVENVLQIAREGLANIVRHASASNATIRAQRAGANVVLQIDDDGVGFRDDTIKPWTISSLAIELGGAVNVASDERGAHLAITIPAS